MNTALDHKLFAAINATINNCSKLNTKELNDKSFVDGLLDELKTYISKFDELYPESERRNLPGFQQLFDYCEQMLVWTSTVPTKDNSECSTLAPNIIPIDKIETSSHPSFDINQETLELWMNKGFKWTNIAFMMGVSPATVKRRVKKFGIQKKKNAISDEELKKILIDLHCEFPDAGYRIMAGFLHDQGHNVSMARVNEQLRKLYPGETAHRWKAFKKRRKYTVPRANSLWHIDGHHKLIHYKMVVHAGIDGYSRRVMFMRCSSDNRKKTVFDEFEAATNQYGIPSRVRGDYGGENRMVAQFMVLNKGLNRGSFIAGKSTGNQRIERHWRDVFTVVISFYHKFFHDIEKSGVLDVENDLHMAALHYVFLPRINDAIEKWMGCWNNHKMRSENNWTPIMMYDHSKLKHASEDPHVDATEYGADWDGLDKNGKVTQVLCDSTKYILPPEVKETLDREIPDLLIHVTDKGKALYLKARQIITHMCSDHLP